MMFNVNYLLLIITYYNRYIKFKTKIKLIPNISKNTFYVSTPTCQRYNNIKLLYYNNLINWQN